MPADVAAQKSALLLMDFQRLVLEERPPMSTEADGGAVSNPAGVIAGALRARAIAKAHGMQVIHIKLRLSPQEISCITPRNKAFSVVLRGEFPPDGSPQLEITPELAPEDGDLLVYKSRFGAFSTTNLDKMLRARDIDTLFVAGTYTSGVVLSTVRDAGDRDYRLFVIADACGDADAELHHALLAKVLPMQADVINAADMETLLHG